MANVPPQLSQDILEKLMTKSDSFMEKLARGEPVDITLDNVQSEIDQKENDEDADYGEDGENSSLEDFQTPSKKKCSDGRAKWNGVLKKSLEDDEFVRKMEHIRCFLVNGTIPQIEDRAARNKLVYEARHKFSIQDGHLMYHRKAGQKPLQVVTDKKQQFRIIQSVHAGLGEKIEGKITYIYILCVQK